MGVRGKIVMWCGDAPNQKALAQKMHQRFVLKAIVIDTKRRQVNNSTNKKSLWTKLYEAFRFWPIHYSWRNMMKNYASEFSSWPDIPTYKANNINCPEVYRFTLAQHPDIVVVSGTSMVKEPLLSMPVSIGIMNLHTGLSPYIKGGPNCTNWCIAENNWHLVGNTIMWINAGIDTGNIITTETIEIRDCGSLTEAHLKLMEHAHDLYLRAIDYVLATEPPYPSVPQKDLGEGTLYLSKMWSDYKKKALIYNWRNRKKNKLNTDFFPKTIELPNI